MSDSDCTLSPSARAFSSILSAFIGSVINGLTSGWLIAFITGWIAWLAFFRVAIGGSYMFYRSVTGTWSAEENNSQYEMIDRASSPRPSSEAHDSLINGASKVPSSGTENPNEDSALNPPVLSEFPNIADQEAYHHRVYTSVFPQDSPSILLSRESKFSTFWPTTSDLAIRQESIRLGEQKLLELRRYYASDQDILQALKAYSTMIKQGKLPGPVPSIVRSTAAAYYMVAHMVVNRDVTILGWIGWVYSAVYSPISQIIWIAANASNGNSSGAAKIVKGISVAVTALPLNLDSRLRYANSLRAKHHGGKWAYKTFTLINSISCLFQGIICGTLLIWGVVELRQNTDPFFASSFPWPLVVIYPIFSLIWAWASFRIVPSMDGGRKRASQHHWAGYFVDVGMGIFAGLFLAAPAFALYMSSADPGDGDQGYKDLGGYLSCEAQGWRKFAAIFP